MTFGDEKWELIKQSQLLKIKSQILSNLFNEKYGLRLGEFKNTTGTERVKGYTEQLALINLWRHTDLWSLMYIFMTFYKEMLHYS